MFAVTVPVVSETTVFNRPVHKCLGVLGEASRWDQVSGMGADGRARSHARWVRRWTSLVRVAPSLGRTASR